MWLKFGLTVCFTKYSSVRTSGIMPRMDMRQNIKISYFGSTENKKFIHVSNVMRLKK